MTTREPVSSRGFGDEPSTDAHLELLTEHFGFNPRVFIDALVYAANEHLYSIGGQFEEFAKKQLKTSVKKAIKRERENDNGKRNQTSSSALAKMTATQIDAEAERGVHGVLTLMENALDHVFDLLELYCLKTVFGIKSSQATSITLKHHRGLDLRTVEERVADGDTLTAQDESLELEKREIEMQEKLEKARKTRHALRIANIVAERNLQRTDKVAETFSMLLDESGSEAGRALMNTTTPQMTRKLRYDAQALMDALDRLSSTNPLGPSLINADQTRSLDEHEKRAVIDASGASEKDKRAWERGREAYINWEMDRIIRSVRTRGNETADQTIASFFFTSPSKDYSTSAPAKRRRTTYNSGIADRTVGDDIAQIGEVADIESLADIVSK